jgi:solute carrier family 25 citrate transporter 1
MTFLAGLGAGVAESILIVTPMDVIKIRLQAQRHSLADPLDVPKYRNVGHAAYRIVMEEGVSALYKGVTLTALRQATNQGVNFTVYKIFKDYLLEHQNLDELPSYQSLLAGGISGAFGPMANAPIDTIKTRIQRGGDLVPNESGWTRFKRISSRLYAEEGIRGFYRGLTPRILRISPGQAITFMVYEKITQWINSLQASTIPNKFSHED